MNVKKIYILSLAIIIIVFVYFIWNTNRKDIARNELPPLQFKGIVQEKKTNEFSVKLSENTEKLKKGATISVIFSDKVFDESNVLLKNSEIHLYIDSLRIGEHISIFCPMDRISKNKQIEISRISNIIRGEY